MLYYSALVVLTTLIINVATKCAYTRLKDTLPYIYEGEAFPMNYSDTQQACKDYIGGDVCCN